MMTTNNEDRAERAAAAYDRWERARAAYGERFDGGDLTWIAIIAIPHRKIAKATRLLERAVQTGEALDDERLFRGMGMEPPITDGSVVL